jgi:hypothetical protein
MTTEELLEDRKLRSVRDAVTSEVPASITILLLILEGKNVQSLVGPQWRIYLQSFVKIVNWFKSRKRGHSRHGDFMNLLSFLIKRSGV